MHLREMLNRFHIPHPHLHMPHLLLRHPQTQEPPAVKREVSLPKDVSDRLKGYPETIHPMRPVPDEWTRRWEERWK